MTTKGEAILRSVEALGLEVIRLSTFINRPEDLAGIATPRGWAKVSHRLSEIKPEDVLGVMNLYPVPKSIGRQGAKAVEKAFTRRMAKYAVRQIEDAAMRLAREGKIIPVVGVVKFRKGVRG